MNDDALQTLIPQPANPMAASASHVVPAWRRCCRRALLVVHGNISKYPGQRVGVGHHRATGFSLVEVTLAMGIAAFALLVIFSMLPMGMSSTQSSTRQTTETEIFNRIGSELISVPMYTDPIAHSSNDNLYNYALPSGSGTGSSARFPAYFDIEGNEQKSNLPNTVFIVQCRIEAYDSQTNQSTWKPLSSQNGMGEVRWATVRIGFHKDPGLADNPSPSATPDPQVTKRTFILSNRGT